MEKSKDQKAFQKYTYKCPNLSLLAIYYYITLSYYPCCLLPCNSCKNDQKHMEGQRAALALLLSISAAMLACFCSAQHLHLIKKGTKETCEDNGLTILTPFLVVLSE